MICIVFAQFAHLVLTQVAIYLADGHTLTDKIVIKKLCNATESTDRILYTLLHTWIFNM